MAGTQVRWASDTGPISTAENNRDAAASDADGTRPAEAVNLMRCGGLHTSLAPQLPSLASHFPAANRLHII